MNSTLVYTIHILVVLIFALIGYFIGMSLTSTGIGLLVGIIAAVALYFFWGKKELAAQ